MAGSAADYMEGKVADWFMGTTFPAPIALWLGLFTVIPPDTGTESSPANGTEASGTNYARVQLTSPGTNFTKAAAGTTTQLTWTAAITMATAGSGGWGTIVGWGIWDASSAGNLWYYAAISPTQPVNNGQTPSFSANALVLSID